MNSIIIALLMCVFLPLKAYAAEHEHEDSHDHEHEEANSNVGPEKGITEFSEELGFQLSPPAIKNFELQNFKLIKAGPWQIPSSAVLHSGEEVNLFRVRNGFYKRIDFITDKKSAQELTIRSKDLKEGDEVVIQGIGFLRTAEIVAAGGAPEGHSH